jgi:hypothetical protein
MRYVHHDSLGCLVWIARGQTRVLEADGLGRD